MAKKVKIGIPKGSLQETTFELFRKAGLGLQAGPRSYRVNCEDEEIEGTLIRAQEIARYVEEGAFDAGLTGLDWIKENNAKVVQVTDLVYAKQSMRPVKWVLAVPEDSLIKSVKGLQGKRVATELVNITKKYLRAHKVTAEVEFSWGATEIKAPDLVDAIVEVTETGTSLMANKLRIVDVVLESWTKLIANKKSWENRWKRRKIENITMLLTSAIEAENRVGMKLNVRQKSLKKILNLLPSITAPTVSGLSEGEWVAVETILEESAVRELIPELKRAGAVGIIEYPLNKVVF